MEAKRPERPLFSSEGQPISALGLRLRKIRERIEAAAERGETKLLRKEKLEQLLDRMRPSDPDVS